FETVVPSAGVYVVELEALDDQQRTIARSALKEIKVSEAPRLPAPEFAENLPSIIKSDARGNVRVNWTAVEGARKYQVFIEDLKSQKTLERTVERETASLSKLQPGQYRVKVQAIDSYGRAG